MKSLITRHSCFAEILNISSDVDLLSTNIPTTSSLETKDFHSLARALSCKMAERAMRSDAKQPVYKVSLFFAPQSKSAFQPGFSKLKWCHLAESFTKKIGLKNHQRVVLFHINSAQVDLIINLIDHKGKINSRAFDYYINKKALIEIEQELLDQDNSLPKNAQKTIIIKESRRQKAEGRRFLSDGVRPQLKGSNAEVVGVSVQGSHKSPEAREQKSSGSLAAHSLVSVADAGSHRFCLQTSVFPDNAVNSATFMRTKCSRSQSFRQTLSYVMGKKKSLLISTNIPTANSDNNITELVNSMNSTASRGQTTKPCYHVSISPSDKDLEKEISKLKWYDLAESFTQKIGLKNHQRVAVLHFDTGRPHLHLVYNLVDRNGKTYSLSYNYYKNQSALKEIENELGLEPTWDNQYWLKTDSLPIPSGYSIEPSQEKLDRTSNIASTCNNFLELLGLNSYTGDKYLLEKDNNTNTIRFYRKNPRELLMSAYLDDGQWLAETSKISDPELHIFQQLERQIRDYLELNFEKEKTNQNPHQNWGIEL